MEDVVALVSLAEHGDEGTLAEAAVGLHGVEDGEGEVDGQFEALSRVSLVHGLAKEVRCKAKNVCVDFRHSLDVGDILLVYDISSLPLFLLSNPCHHLGHAVAFFDELGPVVNFEKIVGLFWEGSGEDEVALFLNFLLLLRLLVLSLGVELHRRLGHTRRLGILYAWELIGLLFLSGGLQSVGIQIECYFFVREPARDVE